MAQAKLTPQQLQEAVNLKNKYATVAEASQAIGIPMETLRHRIHAAKRLGYKPTNGDESFETSLKDRIQQLESLLRVQKSEQLDAEFIKSKIIKLKEHPYTVPKWLAKAKTSKNAGIPTLFASDWHWGEVVDPKQIGGVNEFNLEIAQNRAKLMITKAIDLLQNHIAHNKYEGIVFALGGDMSTGDIHEELMATNEKEVMPTILDMFGVLIWCIDTLAKEFGNVFVPCVSGNHGRNTHKIRMKGRNFTNFDWLLYQFLAKHFENDKRVKFLIPDGPDAYYQIYGHRYLLTHGDQFRGGDGVIGALGPIIRGDHKKRSRNAQIDMAYDTMIIGHWHQLIQLQRLIVNGSLKGYDEYAYSNNFGFEEPRQALWITHPEHGITFSMAVNVGSPSEKEYSSWVSWKN